MARTYTTRAGDMLDLICYHHYAGRQAGAVEAVLEANQALDLSGYAPMLPRGLVITLPDLPGSAVSRRPTIKLWDE